MTRSSFIVAALLATTACQPQQPKADNSEEDTPAIVPPKDAKFAEPATMEQWLAKNSNSKMKSAAAADPSIKLVAGSDGRHYMTPTKAPEIPGKGGVMTDVTKLTAEQIIDELSLTNEDISIEQLDAQGNVTPIFGNLSGSKGIYRVTYYYYRYTNVPCDPKNPSAGAVGVGVGVTATANFNTTKSKLNVGIMNLAASAEASYAQGRISIKSNGIKSAGAKISSYLSGAKSLTAEGLKDVVESMGVVKAIFDVGGLTAEPYYLFIQASDPAYCPAAGLYGKSK